MLHIKAGCNWQESTHQPARLENIVLGFLPEQTWKCTLAHSTADAPFLALPAETGKKFAFSTAY